MSSLDSSVPLKRRSFRPGLVAASVVSVALSLGLPFRFWLANSTGYRFPEEAPFRAVLADPAAAGGPAAEAAACSGLASLYRSRGILREAEASMKDVEFFALRDTMYYA